MLKASLHVHTKEDPCDYIRYDAFEFLDRAHELGFEVIAFTCHERVIYTKELRAYAKKIGILLIPGIEVNLGGHILILNADKEAETLKTLSDLQKYRSKRPEIFTIAAHPFFPSPPKTILCLKDKLEPNINLFDGIEQSWFYSRLINWNKPAQALATKKGLPYIATSDIHIPEQMHNGHVLIEADKNIESVLEALREKRFTSVVKPQGVFQMWWIFAKMQMALKKKHLPWTPPHIASQHENLPTNHQRKGKKGSKKDPVS